MKGVRIVKVVSHNLLVDWWSKVQNLFGANLTSYEMMIEKGMQQVQDEIKQRNLKLAWYRYEITQFTNGAVVIMLYGDRK